ncbi:MAG: hypothetical protein U1F27_17040 [Turneriella sp.]
MPPADESWFITIPVNFTEPVDDITWPFIRSVWLAEVSDRRPFV